MSLSGEEARKTEALPGAFPSEDAIAHSQSNSTDSTTSATTGRSTNEYHGRDLTSRQDIAHTGAGQAKASPADADPDHLLRRAGAEGVPAPGAATSGLGSQQNSDSVLGNAAVASAGRAAPRPGGLASAANPLSGPAVAADDDLGPENGPKNAPDITEDLKNLGSGAATAATVVGLAARDAAVAFKDAAVPVVSAASEQVRKIPSLCLLMADG